MLGRLESLVKFVLHSEYSDISRFLLSGHQDCYSKFRAELSSLRIERDGRAGDRASDQCCRQRYSSPDLTRTKEWHKPLSGVVSIIASEAVATAIATRWSAFVAFHLLCATRLTSNQGLFHERNLLEGNDHHNG